MRRFLAISLITCLAISMIGVVSALIQIGSINVGYKITPIQPPTMTPSTVSLNLGDIPSGSSGEKDFGKVATLYLPSACKVTFTLDRESASDFSKFEVTIKIFKKGEELPTTSVYLSNTYWDYESSKEIDAGTYDIYISVKYKATSVATETTGTVTITISYPG